MERVGIQCVEKVFALSCSRMKLDYTMSNNGSGDMTGCDRDDREGKQALPRPAPRQTRQREQTLPRHDDGTCDTNVNDVIGGEGKREKTKG